MQVILETSDEDWVRSWYLKSNSVHSEKGARDFLKSFDSFLKLKYPDNNKAEMFEFFRNNKDSNQVYVYLNQFIQYLMSNGLASRTVKIKLMFAKSYFRSKGVSVYNEDVKQFVMIPKTLKRIKKPMTRDHVKKLLERCWDRQRALILTLVSSGMRVGEAIQIRVRDVDTTKHPTRIFLRAETTKGREDAFAFISDEATEKLLPLLEGKRETDYVFTEDYKPLKSVHVKITQFTKLRSRCGLNEKQNGSDNRYVVHLHGTRGVFYTEALEVLGEGKAHAMIRHHGYIDTYYQKDVDKMADDYLKIMPRVTISDDARIEYSEENTKRVEQKIKSMEEDYQRMQRKLERLERIRS